MTDHTEDHPQLDTPGPYSSAARFWSVIPAGGSGTRLWPLSRSGRPKFLLSLLGERSLLQQTVDRLALVTSHDKMMVVCGPAHAAQVARQLPELPADHVIVEPGPKGTGPAIALAAAIIARQDPTAVMGSFAADHDVRDPGAFANAVQTAIRAAEKGWLVTIGLQPTRPETGYGYIQRTTEPVAVTDMGTAYRAGRFIEKPDLHTAKVFLSYDRYLWNASMFIWRVDVFLAQLARLQPEVAAVVTRIAASWGSPEQDEVVGELWPTLPNVTIDNGVMELAHQIAVVPASMGWSDVGDWHGLGELITVDEDGNSVHGDVVCAGGMNSVVWSETSRVISLVGLDNIIVVDTPDALLVADRRQAQNVRAAVARLQQLNRTTHL